MKSKLFILPVVLFLSFFTAYSQEWQETQKILNPSSLADEYYGQSIAIYGDYAVIGAVGHDNERGYAFVYHYNGSYWEEQATLKGTDIADGDRFGTSVAIYDDVIAIGAIYNNDHGAVYVYVRPSTGWANMTQTAKLTASDAASGDNLGAAVSVSKDVIIAGAPYDDDNGSNSGSVYLYTKPSSGWADATENIKFKPSDGTTYGMFGSALSITEDIMVVGAWGDGSLSGAAYLYIKPSSGWESMNESVKLSPSDAKTGKLFGASVAIFEDVVLIGAYKDDEKGTECGAAYIFQKGASWQDISQKAKLTASDAAEKDWFGNKVAIYNNYIAIGAWHKADNGTNSGAAYIFEKPGTEWTDMTETGKMLASDGTDEDWFSYGLAIYGDNILIGSPQNSEAASKSGSVYFFKRSIATATNNLSRESYKIYPNPTNGKINVCIPDYDNNTQIIIFDQNGKTIESKTVKQKNTYIDISDKPHGIYIMQINNNGKIHTSKIIKK